MGLAVRGICDMPGRGRSGKLFPLTISNIFRLRKPIIPGATVGKKFHIGSLVVSDHLGWYSRTYTRDINGGGGARMSGKKPG